MPGADDEPWDVPEAWRDAAEEIRAHLCHLRGGAPFLSPADAHLLVTWLDQEVPVARVLRALERAAEARRQTRSKVPLRLGHAKRHLGRPTRGLFATERPARGSEPVLAPVVRALKAARAETDPRPRRTLEAALLAIDGSGEQAVTAALAAIRAFLDEVWRSLGAEGQHELRRQAVDELGDLLELVDEGTAVGLVEETARDLLRQGYPALTAASLWELVESNG